MDSDDHGGAVKLIIGPVATKFWTLPGPETASVFCFFVKTIPKKQIRSKNKKENWLVNGITPGHCSSEKVLPAICRISSNQPSADSKEQKKNKKKEKKKKKKK